MVTVKMSEEKLLDILIDMVVERTTNDRVADLYVEMYENMIDNGEFYHLDVDLEDLVDYDFKTCKVIYPGQPGWEECNEAYINDERELEGGGYIEAIREDDNYMGIFLVRIVY